MDDARDLEALADSILDQHRTGPVGGHKESLHEWALKRQARRDAKWAPILGRMEAVASFLWLLLVVGGALMLLAISSG